METRLLRYETLKFLSGGGNGNIRGTMSPVIWSGCLPRLGTAELRLARAGCARTAFTVNVTFLRLLRLP